MPDQSSAEGSPFHAGERAVQDRLGVGDVDVWARRMVRDHLPEQHRAFHTAQPFLIVSARDHQGRPWATMLSGPEGFISSPDPRTLRIAARPVAGDALENAMVSGADLGILGIELETRRRNRLNGRISVADDGGLSLAVTQAFGNCPQYIRERPVHRVRARSPLVQRRASLTFEQRRLIAAADTFFIASGYRDSGDSPTFGMDASHRGGPPGFVEVLDDRHLRFPDYAGNNHFNTIGNLVADARIGLLFVDFVRGDLLQLTGTAAIDWTPVATSRFPGARRLIDVEIEAVVQIRHAVGLRWRADGGSVRSLRVMDKIRESDDVFSFILEARDGGDLPSFKAGQHLPVELRINGRAEPVSRTYSLSGSPENPRYRISVKRHPGGQASSFLHDRIEPGAIIDARPPAGDFVLGGDRRPVVLVSAGIGVTPMVSMLHALTGAGVTRPVLFVHGARNGRHHPLSGEIADLARGSDITMHIAYSHPESGEVAGRDFHSHGRVDTALLARLGDLEESVFYLCGPHTFMADLSAGLEGLGVPLDRIRTETF